MSYSSIISQFAKT